MKCLLGYYFRTEDEKDEWLDALYIAVKNYFAKINTLDVKKDPENCVGLEKPRLENASTAKCCSSEDCFTKFRFVTKGHNCDSCGKVR